MKLGDLLHRDVVILAADLVFDGPAPFYRKKSLGDKTSEGKDFETLKRTHVEGFYRFLAYAGRKSKVL